MPSAITCPACKRVLNLPAEALNRLVQCPACKHQFHPAEALPAEAIRPAKVDYAAARPDAPKPEPATSEASAKPVDRRSLPAPPPMYEPRRSDRRGKRDAQDLCPNCQAFVPAGVNKCAECGAEFDPADDEHYRPWEQAGIERRDSLPHRGGLLLSMGIGSLILPMFFMFCYLGIVTSLAGLVLASAAVTMGRGDLRKMRDHAMIREGQGITHGGVICGMIGIALNVMALIAAIVLTAQLW